MPYVRESPPQRTKTDPRLISLKAISLKLNAHKQAAVFEQPRKFHLGARWDRKFVFGDLGARSDWKLIFSDFCARWKRKIVWDGIIVMTHEHLLGPEIRLGRLGRSLGPEIHMGRDHCSDTWARAWTGKSSLLAWALADTGKSFQMRINTALENALKTSNS